LYDSTVHQKLNFYVSDYIYIYKMYTYCTVTLYVHVSYEWTLGFWNKNLYRENSLYVTNSTYCLQSCTDHCSLQCSIFLSSACAFLHKIVHLKM